MGTKVLRSPRIPTDQYLAIQIAIATKGDNAWYTGVEKAENGSKEPPTASECMMHFVQCGAAETFAAIHSDQHIYFAGLAADCNPLDLSPELREAVLIAVWEFWQEIIAQHPEEFSRVVLQGL